MRRFLQRRWFLLLLAAGGLVVAFCPGGVRWTARIDPRWIVAPSLFLAALGLESRSLYRTLVRPLPALWGLAVSYGLLPALGWALAPAFALPDYHVGLMIIASVPCTLASAVIWTRLAGGCEATALLIVLLTTATSWLATTAWLSLGTGAAVAVESLAMMRGLFLVLVLPVAAGQLARRSQSLARATDDYRPWVAVFVRLLTLVIILKAAVDVTDRLRARPEPLAAGPLLVAAASCLGLHLAALFTGLWSSRGLGFDRPHQIAIAIAGSQKTLPVALYLFDLYFQDYPLAVVPMVVYHVGQLVVDTVIAEGFAGRKEPVDLPAEAVV